MLSLITDTTRYSLYGLAESSSKGVAICRATGRCRGAPFRPFLLIKFNIFLRFCKHEICVFVFLRFSGLNFFDGITPTLSSFQAVESISLGSTLKVAAWFGTYRESTCRLFLGGIFGQTWWTLNSYSFFFFLLLLLLFWFSVRIQERSLNIQHSNPRFVEAVELNTSPSAMHLTIRRIHGHLESRQQTELLPRLRTLEAPDDRWITARPKWLSLKGMNSN